MRSFISKLKIVIPFVLLGLGANTYSQDSTSSSVIKQKPDTTLISKEQKFIKWGIDYNNNKIIDEYITEEQGIHIKGYITSEPREGITKKIIKKVYPEWKNNEDKNYRFYFPLYIEISTYNEKGDTIEIVKITKEYDLQKKLISEKRIEEYNVKNCKTGRENRLKYIETKTRIYTPEEKIMFYFESYINNKFFSSDTLELKNW